MSPPQPSANLKQSPMSDKRLLPTVRKRLFTFQRRPKGPLSNDYYISSDVKFNSFGGNYNLAKKYHKKYPEKKSHKKSCIKISHKKIPLKNPDPAIFFAQILLSHPFYAAQYIFPTYIQLLVPNLSMNLSLNLSKIIWDFIQGNTNIWFCDLIYGVYVYRYPKLMYAAKYIFPIFTCTQNLYIEAMCNNVVHEWWMNYEWMMMNEWWMNDDEWMMIEWWMNDEWMMIEWWMNNG